jgi:hypothetical protein
MPAVPGSSELNVRTLDGMVVHFDECGESLPGFALEILQAYDLLCFPEL